MALTATASQGFEEIGETTGKEILWIPGDPGDTYTKGDRVVGTVGEGVVDPLAANEGGAVGTAMKTIVCPAATVAMPLCSVDVADPDYNGCLIPVSPEVPAGKKIYRVTFENHYDCTVAAYVAATRILTIAAAPGADDYQNGALVYVYEGTGAGQVNVVEDATNGTPSVTLHRPFSVALDTTSKIIMLSGEAVANRGIGFFNRFENAHAGLLTCDQGSDDGDYVLFMDFREVAQFMKDLTVKVIDFHYGMLA